MSITDKEIPPELICWLCGKKGEINPLSTCGYRCLDCDVTWELHSIWPEHDLETTWWNGKQIGCVDFTQPDAPSSPA